MEKIPTGTRSPSEGFLLLDSSVMPILVNLAAAQILLYPKNPEEQRNLNSQLARRVRTMLFLDQSNGSAPVSKFQSGRRTYICRSFRVNGMMNGYSEASLVVLLERESVRSASIDQLSERFHFTTREREVAQFLLQGLTSKEIGVRMEISSHTVKKFLRQIMMKTGVSSRCGIVGKALTMGQQVV